MIDHDEPSGTPVVAAAERLGAAFAARDVAAALACFVTDDDIGYAGSERTENAAGRAAVEALLTRVFAKLEDATARLNRELGVPPDIDVGRAAEELAATARPDYAATRVSG